MPQIDYSKLAEQARKAPPDYAELARQARTSGGASGSWKRTPEQLPTALRVPMQAAKSVLGGVAQIGQGARNVLGMPLDMLKTAYGAFTADPQTLAPEEIPSYTTAGPGGLALHRLLIQPQLDQAKQAAEAPTKSEAFGHGLAAVMPFAGPFAAHLGETVGEGRPLEAAGEVLTAGLLPKLAGEAKTYIQNRPVRLGRTTLDPATGKPIAAKPPIEIPHGLPSPEIPPGQLPEYSVQTNKIAKGLGLADDVEGNVRRNAIAEVYPDLKYAQQNAEGVRGPVNTPAKFRAVLDWSNNRIWNTILEPEIRQSGKMQNLATLSKDVQAQLPEHVKAFYNEMVQNKLDPIQKIIDQYKKPGEAIPQLDPMMIHGLVKAIRNELDLATTPMEQGIQRQLPKGEILFELNKVLRDKLYDHVQTTRKVDIRTAARKYGMTAGIKGEAANLSTPKGFFETLFSSYTFPTPRAIAARIGETAGKQLISDMKELKRGFDIKMTPAEEALVTRPSLPKLPYRSSIAGQTQVPGRGPSIERGPEPDMIAPEPQPGPTAIIRPYGGGPTPKGEAYWPERTPLLGRQSAFGENALPDKPMPPTGSKTGEFTFYPGKSGKKTEIVIDPETGKPIQVRRDYRAQKQLFSEPMTAPPRWKPTEHVTSTLLDLQQMRTELVNYLQRGTPTAAARKEYIADVRSLQAEIKRRQAARKAGQQQ